MCFFNAQQAAPSLNTHLKRKHSKAMRSLNDETLSLKPIARMTRAKTGREGISVQGKLNRWSQSTGQQYSIPSALELSRRHHAATLSTQDKKFNITDTFMADCARLSTVDSACWYICCGKSLEEAGIQSIEGLYEHTVTITRRDSTKRRRKNKSKRRERMFLREQQQQQAKKLEEVINSLDTMQF